MWLRPLMERGDYPMADETPPDTGTEMESVPSPDGTKIAFERTGSGPPLVLVHGAGLDRDFWELSDLRPALAEQHTVYAIDRRGRGGSGDADEYDLEREIEDVAAVVESIDGPVTLLGHSYGALIALEAALRTDNLHGLVLYEPFTEGMPQLEQLLGSVHPMLAGGEVVLGSSPSWQELVDAADTLPREFERFIEYEFDTDRFTGMTTPTLLFTGGESPQPLIDATETIDETLPDSRIVVFDGHGHFAMNAETDRFIDELLTFIRETA